MPRAKAAPKAKAKPKAKPAPEGQINWVRPSGNPITTNDKPATIAHCEAQGWERA